MSFFGETSTEEAIAGYVMAAAVGVLLIAWEVSLMRRLMEAQLRIAQEQHIRATSPDPVARPSSHERLSSEKPA